MKKILALVLATALLSSMAMAGDLTVGSTSDAATSKVVTPGSAVIFPIAAFNHNTTNLPLSLTHSYKFNSDNFSIASKTFSKGGNLVEKVVVDDDSNKVKINLLQNYDLKQPALTAAPNLVIKKLSIKVKNTIKEGAITEATKGNEYIYNENYNDTGDLASGSGLYVGYAPVKQAITSGTANYTSGTMHHFANAGTPEVTSEDYGTASLTDSDIYLEGRVYKGDKVFVEVKTSPSDEAKAIMKDPANGDAEMRFVKVVTNGLPSNHSIQVLAEEDEFVYQIKDGKLVASGLKWNEDDYAWVGKIRSTTEYVISDIELVASADAADPSAPDVNPNPDTGANDVVGIAAALAVVSLVAAGAVSLKK